MHCYRSHPPGALGIDRVVLAEYTPVSRVDVMTRDPRHAADLETLFGVRPFRFTRLEETLYAFPRLPAASARAWLEDRGIQFVVTDGALGRRDVATWVQAGFAAGHAAH